MVIVEKNSQFSKNFFQFFERSLKQSTNPEEFYKGIFRLEGFTTTAFLDEIKKILQKAPKILYEDFHLPVDYLNIFFYSEKIDNLTYIEALTNFERFDKVNGLKLIIESLCNYVKSAKCSYVQEDSCFNFSQTFYFALKWMIFGLERILSSELPLDLMEFILAELINGINFLKNDPFSSLLIYLYFDFKDESPFLLEALNKANELVMEKKENYSDGEFPLNSIVPKIDSLFDTLEDFKNLPEFKWEYFREDFICKEFRPAILTMGSIFATFRVLKSDSEVANAFLSVGEILGISRTQIVFDILRSGFLVQLETASAQPEIHCGVILVQDKEALAEIFGILKVPQILAKLLQLGVSKEEIFMALDKISRCTTLLNEVDIIKSDNLFEYMIEALKNLNVIENESYKILQTTRKNCLDQQPLFLDVRRQPRVKLIAPAQKAYKIIKTVTDLKRLFQMVQKLVQPGHIVDTVCSVCCADGDLPSFSAKMAELNSLMEKPLKDPEDSINRMLFFNYTFLLLSRIQHVYTDMKLEDLVGDCNQGIYYKWRKLYTNALEKKEPIPVNQHFKMNFAVQINRLKIKDSQPIWNESWDFAEVINHVPLIGDIILDEYNKNEPPNENEIHNILSTFYSMSCLFLCLIQWLETQKPSLARQSFARTLLHFESLQEKDNNDRWLIIMMIAKKSLKQMAESRHHKGHSYTWVINFAQRQLPTIYQTEATDLQVLKEVFLYANQQSWASPDVIAHIDRCNRAIEKNEWCMCWLMQMLKSWTSDEMEVASELCLATALTDPIPCLMEIIRQLVEYVLFDYSSSTTTSRDGTLTTDKCLYMRYYLQQHHYQNVPINKTSATVLAKMLVRAFILLLWANDCSNNQKSSSTSSKASGAFRKRKHLAEGDVGPSSGGGEYPSSSLKAENPSIFEKSSSDTKIKLENKVKGEILPELPNDFVLEAINKVFGQFDKVIGGGCLRPSITFIIFFIHELAKAPKTKHSKQLVEMLPSHLIFSLARLDAAALPLSMFLQLHDVNEQKYKLPCLKYACLMRYVGLV